MGYGMVKKRGERKGELVYVYAVFGAIIGVAHDQGEAETEILKALEQVGVFSATRADGPIEGSRKGLKEVRDLAAFFVDRKGNAVGYWGRFKIGQPGAQ